MVKSDFFEEPSEASKLKARLMADYFDTWSNIIVSTVRKKEDKKFAYIDFFAGPGVYKDGTKTTPLLVLEKAIQHPEKREMLMSIFNDVNSGYLHTLESKIKALPGIHKLKHQPQILDLKIESDSEIIEELSKMSLIPTLFFIDPFGYKGLSLNLIRSVLKDWGSDGIFFFNYLRVNMALSNPYMRTHMEALFGKDRFKALQSKIEDLNPSERERLVVDDLVEALNDIGGTFVLDFRFAQYGEERTSHYLIFVTKHIKGYKVMKEILAKNSSSNIDGIASFEFNPNVSEQFLPFLEGIERLERMLVKEFRGKILTMEEIYAKHDIGKPYTRHYTEANYKDALRNLEDIGQIKTDPPASNRPKKYGKVTFGPSTRVQFKKL